MCKVLRVFHVSSTLQNDTSFAIMIIVSNCSYANTVGIVTPLTQGPYLPPSISSEMLTLGTKLYLELNYTRENIGRARVFSIRNI